MNSDLNMYLLLLSAAVLQVRLSGVCLAAPLEVACAVAAPQLP